MDRESNPVQATPSGFLQEKKFFDIQLLTYKDAAKYLSVSESYLRKLKARRQIPYVFVGNRGVRFRVSSLILWLEKREVT